MTYCANTEASVEQDTETIVSSPINEAIVYFLKLSRKITCSLNL